MSSSEQKNLGLPSDTDCHSQRCKKRCSLGVAFSVSPSLLPPRAATSVEDSACDVRVRSTKNYFMVSELCIRYQNSKIQENIYHELLGKDNIRFKRVDDDRTDVPINYKLLKRLLQAAGDPDEPIGSYALRVRVGPRFRMPRRPRPYTKNRKWRNKEQREQVHVDEVLSTQGLWNKNYSTLSALRTEVEEVLRDQAKRGQVLMMPEVPSKRRFPNLVVASLGALKKEKPGGVVSARVLFDGTNGSFVNTSSTLRDQERAPVAADPKRLMREKAGLGQVTFGLTADVKEVHR